jgi:AcrR family transcriptional regulator
LCTHLDISGGGGDDRALILRAAIEVVAQEGYPRASVQAIIGQAGLPRETFDRYFRTRRDCFLAAYDAAMAGVLDSAAEAAEAEADPRRQAYAALRCLLERLAAQPAVARACLVELRRAGPGGLSHEDRVMGRLAGLLLPARELARGELSGELIAGGVWETIRTTLLGGSPSDLPGLLPELYAWLTHGSQG